MHDLGSVAYEMTRLVNGVRDDQLGEPTPCSEYTLGDLLQHVRGLAETFTLAGRKEQPSGGSKPPPKGDASLRASAVGLTAANELVVHGWDVARASGQQLDVDEVALAPSREFVAMMSGLGSEEARGDAFGPALPVPAGASALDEVIAGNGRDPAWSARQGS